MRISTSVDRLQQAGPRLLERLLEAKIAGDLERDVLRVHRVHLAIVELDLHIHHAIAGQDAFLARLHDALLHRRHETPVHVLARKRFRKLEAAVARLRLDLHPDFGELAGAARLLLVAILGVAPALDGLAIPHARLDQFDVHVVTAAEALGDDLQVQLALRGQDGLVQLGIHHVQERGVLVVQRGQARGDLVFLAFDVALEGGVDVRLGIFDCRQRHRFLAAAQRVARMGVLELHHRADVPGAEAGHARAHLAVEQVDLADLLRAAPGGVEEFAAELDRAGIDAEERKLAKLRLAHRLEDVEHRVGTGQDHFHLVAVRIGGFHLGPVHRRGAVFGDEIHQPRDADIAFRRRAEHRHEHLLLDGRMQTGASLLLRQPALGEELLHQRIVRLGNVFDELAVQLLGPLGQCAGGRRFGELAALVGRVGDDLAAQHVQHLVEPGAGIDRDDQREHTLAEVLAKLRQRLVKIRLLFVERIHDDDLRDAVRDRAFPDRVGADTRPVVGVHHHHRQVAHAQRPHRFADEIHVARAIQDVELLALPIQVHERGGDGDLPVLLALVVVRDGGAGGDGPHAVDHAGTSQHGLTEHGFPARSVAYDGEVTNVTRLIIFHNVSLTIPSDLVGADAQRDRQFRERPAMRKPRNQPDAKNCPQKLNPRMRIRLPPAWLPLAADPKDHGENCECWAHVV